MTGPPPPMPLGPIYSANGKLSQTPDFAAMPEGLRAYWQSRFIQQLCFIADKYPENGIDKSTLHLQSLEWMHGRLAGYTDTLKVKSKISNYKYYFAFAVTLLQLFFIHILGLEAKGFARAQLQLIASNRYDALLTEIGENHSIEGVGGWPAEARLAIALGINLLSFIVLHLVGRWIGKQAGKGGNVAIPILESFHTSVLDIFSPVPATGAGAAPGPGDGLQPEAFEGQRSIEKMVDLGETIMGTVKGMGFLGGAAPAQKPAAPAPKPTPPRPPVARPAMPKWVD